MADENENVGQALLKAAQALQCEEVNYMVMSVIREALDNIEAAYKREIAAKDKEIEDLKSLDEAHRNLALRAVKADNKKREEIAKRDALIEELADAIADDVIVRACGGLFPHICKQQAECGWSKLCALVKKAREVIAKSATPTEAAGEDAGND